MAATVSLSAFLTACGDDAPDPSNGADSASPNEVTVPVSAVAVDLLDPGAEPRSPVSYRLAAGIEQRTTLVTEAKVSQQIDTQSAQDFSSPEITLLLDAQVAEVEDTGAAVVDLTIDEATSPDARLGSALEDSDGSGAGLTVQPDGSVTALRLRPTAESQDIARSAIEQAMYQSVYRTVACPEEPLGIAAQWTVRQQVVSGIALEQTTTATLVARDGDRLTVDYTVTQAPESPTWTLPNDAGTLQIEQYTMEGSGQVVVDLARPLPVEGQVRVGGEQAYTDPNGATALRQGTDNTVRWESE